MANIKNQIDHTKTEIDALERDKLKFIDLLADARKAFEAAKTNGAPFEDLATLRGKVNSTELMLEDQEDFLTNAKMNLADLEREFNVTAKRAYILEQNQVHATAMQNQTAILAEVEAFLEQKREALSIENQAMQSANREAITTARALGAENENAVSKVFAEVCAEAGVKPSVNAWGASSIRWPWIKEN